MIRPKKQTLILSSLAALSIMLPAGAEGAPQKFRRAATLVTQAYNGLTENTPEADSIAAARAERLRVREVDEIISSLPEPDFPPTPVNKVFAPRVFLGYRNLLRKGPDLSIPGYLAGVSTICGDQMLTAKDVELETMTETILDNDSTGIMADMAERLVEEETAPADLSLLTGDATPKWLRDALNSYRIQEDFIYSEMVADPRNIQYAYWDLPVPPRLLEDDVTFAGYMRRLNLPDIDVDKAVLPEEVIRKRHWLHNVGASLHFSQAFVSSNWYQGGNNHLALLFNFGWNVQLNPVYHPNLLFQSSLQYKLGLNSTPQDEVHKYSISEDLLQYNLNTGIKAFKKWFYSLNAVFKTQILRNYEQNSTVRTASFLSPGDLNIGLGMAYSHTNTPKTLQLTATISPLSYNLKTCITDKIDHALFNIAPDRKTRSEFGSNGEFTMLWQITPNIGYKTRVFLFTDYSYFLADWENTVNFEINKFLSTQIYVHLRYDTSTESLTKWKHLQMREVLSFGLSYTFSTKP